MNRPRAPWTFLAAALGSLAGAALLLRMRPEPLRPIVVGLLVLAGVIMAVPARERAAGFSSRARTLGQASARAAAVALVLGAYDGFFGPGAGSLLIIGFMVFLGDTPTAASGNAKVANLASNLAALAVFVHGGRIVWRYALPMAAGNALGAYVGARLALSSGDRLVRRVVSLVVAAVAIKLTWDIVHR